MLNDVYALDAYSGSAENLSRVGTKITDDDIFGDGDWKLQVPTITGDVDSGYVGKLRVAVDTTTEARGGGAGGGGGGQPSGGAGGPPSGNPPSGNPPSGNPPSGGPPSGDPPSNSSTDSSS
jgi:hypothetical protein